MNTDKYVPGFEENHDLRSEFIRDIILKQCEAPVATAASLYAKSAVIPKLLLRYWHDPHNLPEDVRVCLSSWDRLASEGFEFLMFDDASAAKYIADVYGESECKAFARCGHPAMRCDYLRLCFILAEGGFYVDADDVLLSDEWRCIFQDGRLKVQPLCYDNTVGRMMPAADIWRTDLPPAKRIFYVNNDPLAAPAGHPLIRRALARATEKLLTAPGSPEIQSTTGPGNLTASLAAHAWHLEVSGLPPDFEIIRGWDAIAEMRWHLSYRNDARNWRLVYGC